MAKKNKTLKNNLLNMDYLKILECTQDLTKVKSMRFNLMFISSYSIEVNKINLPNTTFVYKLSPIIFY